MKTLLGQRIREQRRKKGWTMDKLAEKADLSVNYVGDLERGVKTPSLDAFIRIVEALDCDFTDCVFVDCSFTKCELDHTTLNECKFVRCEITGLRSTHSSVQSLDFEDCRLNEIEWAPLMSNGAFPDPIHTLKECSLKYNTFTEMNFNRFDFSDGNEIVGSMFAKCEMQLANFKGVELHETEFYQCDLRKADFRDAAGYKVDILGSRLKDAKFSLPEAVNLLADLKIKLS